jgi:hypothetical protein
MSDVAFYPFMPEGFPKDVISLAVNAKISIMAYECEQRIKDFMARTGLPASEVAVIQTKSGHSHIQWRQAVKFIPEPPEMEE